MWQLKPFSNRHHQLFFEALKNADIEKLKKIDYKSICEEDLIFCPYFVFRAYYSRYSKSSYFEVEDYLRSKGFKEKENEFTRNLELILTGLMLACDEKPNRDYIMSYLSSGHDVHKYNPIYLFSAVYVKEFEIAELLIKGGSNLTRFPFFLQDILSSEFDYYVSEHIDAQNQDYHMDDERTNFLIKYGAVINSRDVQRHKGKTPLDLAKDYGHWPAYKVIKAHGGKFASEIDNN